MLVGLLSLLVVAGAIAWGALELTGALDHDAVDSGAVIEAAQNSTPDSDPFAWDASREADFEQRAALGNSHVLYEEVPGGVIASAKRTAAWDDEIKIAAKRYGVDPDLMEAMVFLESAGRPDVIAGGTDPAAASGLAQIVASTGSDFLGMEIYLDRSRQLTNQIADSIARSEKLQRKAAKLSGGSKKQQKKAAKLAHQADRADKDAERARRARMQIDPRFDPQQALNGMALYLKKAQDKLGREDLAVTSYHMGLGNLTDVIDSYAKANGIDTKAETPAQTVADAGLSYAQLYFDSSPTKNEQTYKRLSAFEDDSATYYWRVLAAEQIMRLFHTDRAKLNELQTLYTNKATSEEVFHPQDKTRVFDDPSEIQDGLDAGELVPIPEGSQYAYRIGPELGELADKLGVDRKLYESLRPEALATLIYMSSRVQAITGQHTKKDDLIVTSAVRDQQYQDALVQSNPEATSAYSLHTTGYAFDILRQYRNGKEAAAFQFVLDRLQDLGVIDYAVEPTAIHVTVSNEAKPLLDK